MSRVLVLLALVASTFAYHQFRDITCTTSTGTIRGGPERAQCHLTLKDEELEKGRDAPIGAGCFTETSPKGEERVYCDLVCPKAHTVFNAYVDQGHRACFNFYTYQLERRGDEWYMWRSGKCLNSTVNFRIGCKFDEPFSTQFKSDNEIFARLRARA